MAGEEITKLNSGIPLVMRKQDSNFTLANLLKASLFSSIATLKIGMEILEKEAVEVSSFIGHGGFFKTEGVGQKYMAAALNTPVTCMKTAGEGGPYGMALLAAFLFNKNKNLEEFLESEVFSDSEKITEHPQNDMVQGFKKYLEDYKKMLFVEQKATELF